MHFIHSTISIQRYMPQSERGELVNRVRVRPDALSPADLQVYGRPYGFNGTQLSICIPSTPPAVLRNTFSRFRRASRSGRRLRKATAAVGSEALRTAMRRSCFGARTISGSDSASTAGSTGDGGPEPRPLGERARLRLRRQVALGLSGPEECRHRWTSVRSTFFTASQWGRGVGFGMEHARCVFVDGHPSERRP